MKDKFTYRYKHVSFRGHSGLYAPPRNNNQIDEWDIEFDSRDDYEKWYKNLVIGLAELDEVMNYCAYFKRESGNKGRYWRDGKSIEVMGDWDGYHMNTEEMKPFKRFLIENNWLDSWFKLMDRYQKT